WSGRWVRETGFRPPLAIPHWTRRITSDSLWVIRRGGFSGSRDTRDASGSLLMAMADAWRAAGGGISAWRRKRGQRRAGIAGNAKTLVAPAYERLLAIEPVLRRSIPVLIVLFLCVVAAARVMSMMTWRD